ncbi:unnamed protein product, partial [Discosporangium mesarthrocarpum]
MAPFPLLFLGIDMLARCLYFLDFADLCKACRVSKILLMGGRLVLQSEKRLSLGGEPPFIDDNGLRSLVSRCPALTDVEVDARLLSDSGISSLLEGVPGLEALVLYQSHYLTKETLRALARRDMASRFAERLQLKDTLSRGGGAAAAGDCANKRGRKKSELQGSSTPGHAHGHGHNNRGMCPEAEALSETRSCDERSRGFRGAVAAEGVGVGVGATGSGRAESPQGRLQSLSLCNFGELVEEGEAWGLIRELATTVPDLNSLALVNIVEGYLPVDALAPAFVPAEKPLSCHERGKAHRKWSGTELAGSRAAPQLSTQRPKRRCPPCNGGDGGVLCTPSRHPVDDHRSQVCEGGLRELSLANVLSGQVSQALRGQLNL